MCLSEIDKLKKVAGLGDYTEHEVASSSNGDKVACKYAFELRYIFITYNS